MILTRWLRHIKDETLIFGKQGIEVPQGLGDEENRQLGRDWAAKYIDYHVCTATRGIPEAFTQGFMSTAGRLIRTRRISI